MGRRSINTTKSGKYMNPTDQARKEARKRELKKNKKQRQMVRAAVLKGKDPQQLISDMEKIDEMEYNVMAPPLLNEKVLKDKRKKLKETWDRVMRLYFKEDRERFNELKKLQIEYELRRNILVKFFESVRIAQQVQVDEIPLPDTPEIPSFLTSQIPLPSEMELPTEIILPHSILKKSQVFGQREGLLKAPGVPPGPILELSSDEEDGQPIDKAEEAEKSAKSRKIRFADERGIQAAEEHKNTEGTEASEEALGSIINPEDIPIPPLASVPLPSGPPPRLPQGPPPILFRPPPLRPGLPPRMMPPPPPGRPTLPPPGMAMRLGAPPIRLPPGPPPGMPPPRMMRASGAVTVLSAPPSLMQRPKADEERSATIEAKPQIRNLSADLTRFMPTTLRVKREDRAKRGASRAVYDKDAYPPSLPITNPSMPTKDDAYQQFLREMEELL